jgi:hypothetical protein
MSPIVSSTFSYEATEESETAPLDEDLATVPLTSGPLSPMSEELVDPMSRWIAEDGDFDEDDDDEFDDIEDMRVSTAIGRLIGNAFRSTPL